MPVTECIAVYIRLSSEDNDVDGSIKAESNSVSAQRMRSFPPSHVRDSCL